MDRKKGIIFTLLLILTAAFIAFVAFMQHNFMNPEFAVNDDNPDTENNSTEIKNDAQQTDNKDAATELTEKETDSAQVEETEDQVITYSNRIVTVDSLNIRSGPGTDFEISGVVTLDQEVEVEDDGNEWVKITTADFTGYVNEKYLTEE